MSSDIWQLLFGALSLVGLYFLFRMIDDINACRRLLERLADRLAPPEPAAPKQDGIKMVYPKK